MIEMRSFALGTRERIAGSIYGTIVVLAVIADAASGYQHDLWKLEALVVASVVVLWIAHAYAHGLGESLRLERRLTRTEVVEIVSRELAIVFAAILPMVAITIGAFRAVGDSTAVWIAVAVGIATLAVQGIGFARLGQLGLLGTIMSVAINLSLVLLIVLVKVVISH